MTTGRINQVYAPPAGRCAASRQLRAGIGCHAREAMSWAPSRRTKASQSRCGSVQRCRGQRCPHVQACISTPEVRRRGRRKPYASITTRPCTTLCALRLDSETEKVCVPTLTLKSRKPVRIAIDASQCRRSQLSQHRLRCDVKGRGVMQVCAQGLCVCHRPPASALMGLAPIAAGTIPRGKHAPRVARLTEKQGP